MDIIDIYTVNYSASIIALESALSDVQYQIEGLSRTLRNYDRLITFSTIDVYLIEVRNLTIVQEEDTFLSDLKTAAITGTRGLIQAVQSLILTIASGWWFFLGVTVFVLFTRRRLRKRVSTRKVSRPAPLVLSKTMRMSRNHPDFVHIKHLHPYSLGWRCFIMG